MCIYAVLWTGLMSLSEWNVHIFCFAVPVQFENNIFVQLSRVKIMPRFIFLRLENIGQLQLSIPSGMYLCVTSQMALKYFLTYWIKNSLADFVFVLKTISTCIIHWLSEKPLDEILIAVHVVACWFRLSY